MALKSSLHFSGGKALEAALLELSTKSALKVGRAALRKSARPIVVKAKAIVRKKDRRVERSISLRIDRRRDNRAELEAIIYLSDKKFDYRPRKTNKRSRIHGKLVARRYDYQQGSLPSVYGRFIEYGRHKQGVRAFPFMRPAWDSEGGKVAQGRLAAELWDGLTKEISRLGKVR